ncbi:MAG: hypothetical protein FWF76_02395 [Oscillospiraceae bacterium]|nr:hypothetical protein [Oscillospiraceae bacterium]
MKSIKKGILAVVIAGAMLFAVACSGDDSEENARRESSDNGSTNGSANGSDNGTSGNDNESNDGGDVTNNDAEDGVAFEETMFYSEVQRIFGADEFSIEAEIFSVEDESEFGGMILHVRGDDVFIDVAIAGMDMNILITDGLLYIIESEDMMVLVTEADEETLAMFDFNWTGFIFDAADGTVLNDSGETDFFGETLFFEEFIDDDGDVTRFYFDDGVLVASYESLSGEVTVFTFFDSVPDDAFDVPEGYEIMDLEEYMNSLDEHAHENCGDDCQH